MTIAAIKKFIDKTMVWCRQHWRWLVLSSVGLLAFLLGRKNASSLKLEAVRARDQYEKEVEWIEKVHAEKELKKKSAERKYKKALSAINERHASKADSLDKQKEREIKAKLQDIKNDPEQLDSLLKDLGINEV